MIKENLENKPTSLQIPLEVTRRFVKNRDEGFEAYYGGKDSDLLVNFSKLGKTPLIKPVEYKTFLRVGKVLFLLI